MRLYRVTPEQIRAWVDRHFDYRVRAGGRELIAPNPFVPGDTKFKFNIGLVERESRHGIKNYWVHDWRPDCQEWDGSFVKMVMKYKNLSYFEAIRDICGTDLSFTLLTLREEETEAEPEVEINIELPQNAIPFREKRDHRLREIALGYLASRCISEDLAIAHSLYYTASTIVFPYFEYGLLVYWQSREFLSKQFLFPSAEIGCTKDQFLYGFDHVEPDDAVYITESIIDALTIGRGGVAFGGDSFSKTQLRKLRSLNPGKVVVAPDRDSAGKALVKKLYFKLRDYFETIYMALPPAPHKDWNDLDKASGIGSSTKYIAENMVILAPPTIFKLADY